MTYHTSKKIWAEFCSKKWQTRCCIFVVFKISAMVYSTRYTQVMIKKGDEMTKDEATKIAIGFTYDELGRSTNKHLWNFWQGLLAELQDLLSGEYEEGDCVPFICYQTLKDTPVGTVFKEAWGADIGRQGSAIHNVITSLENGLNS